MAEEEKNELTKEETESGTKPMSLKEYIIRLVIWAVIILVPPIVYLEINYGLFTSREGGTVLSGWGVIGVIFLAIAVFYVLTQIKSGFAEGSMFRQCVDGYLRLIPLLAVIIVIHFIKDSIDKMEGFLIVVALCQGIAVPIDPNPKWSKQNDVKTITDALKSIFKRVTDKK